MRLVGIFLACLVFFYHQGIVSSSDPDVHDCQLINDFVGKYTRLVTMIPLNIIPLFKLCSNTIASDYYYVAVEDFNQAKHDPRCNLNFNQNRLNVVQMLYDHMISIWEAANCQDCISNKNETDAFFELSDDLDACIKKYDPNPCDACAGNYSTVQSYYEAGAKIRKGSVCFDIEDRMNQTRHDWSARYNCCKDKRHSTRNFVWIASTISSLPVLFYVFMYVVTRRMEARERACSAPLLDDQHGSEAEEPQPSSSSTRLDAYEEKNDEEIEDFYEPKLNNLGVSQRVRESKLIDVTSDDTDSTINYNLIHSSKLEQIGDDDDDVSILDAMKGNADGRNLLD